MKVTTSKSKNAESFYITQSYIDSNGKSTSYGEHDIYRTLSVLARECDFIQLEAYKNSNFESR